MERRRSIQAASFDLPEAWWAAADEASARYPRIHRALALARGGDSSNERAVVRLCAQFAIDRTECVGALPLLDGPLGALLDGIRLTRSGDLGSGLEALDEVIGRTTMEIDEPVLVWALSERGRALGMAGDKAGGGRDLRAAAELGRRISMPVAENMAWSALGLLYGQEGRSDEYIDYTRRALAVARGAGDVQGEAHCLCNIAGGLKACSRNEEASELYASAEDLARTYDLRTVQALALAGRCVLALHEGRLEEGWGLLEASRVILTAEGNMYQMVWNDLMALEAIVPLENPDLALALCDRASAVAREAEITSLQVRVEDARSRVLEESGDLAGALAASRASTLLERQRAELHLAAAERAGVHAQESLVAFKKAAWERRRRREAEEGALRLREALEIESHLRQLLETTARTDVLTGIPNRRAHEEDLHAVLADAARSSRCVTLLMIDVDRFKSVNDRFGHDVGDEVLVEMAARFRGGLRAADRVSRWGGEEFIVTAPGTDRPGAEHLAEQLRGVIGGRPFATSIGPLEVTVSIGAVVCHPEDTDREEILRRADAALYRAKRGGRNRIVVADREAVQ